MTADADWTPTRPVLYSPYIVALVFAVVPAAVALVGVAEKKPAVVVGGVVAAAVLVVTGLVGIAVGLARRTWAAPAPGGFLFKRGGAVREVAYDDVVSAAVQRQSHYKEGTATHVTRTLTVWLARDGEDLPEAVPLVTKYKVADGDPLAEVVRGVTANLRERARARLSAGQAVLGPDWAWERGTLTVTRPKHDPLTLPLADVVAVDEVENHLCVWLRGRDEAALRVPVKEADSHLLGQLVRDQLDANPPPDLGPDADGLGRVLFERRKNDYIAVYVLAGFLFLVTLGMTFAAVANKQVPLGAVAVMCLAGGVCLFVVGRRAHGDYFRVHERGVAQRSWGKARDLHDRDVEVFSFVSKKIYVQHAHGHGGLVILIAMAVTKSKGQYAGTKHTLKLSPAGGKKGDAIEYSIQLQKNDEELDRLRDRLTRRHADEMRADLEAGRPTPWTANLEIRPDGVAYRPAGWFGRQPWVRAAWRDIDDGVVEDGEFKLFADGLRKPVFKDGAGVDNFYPGFAVFEEMLESFG